MILTHSNCPDGLLAAFLLQDGHPGVIVIPLEPGKQIEEDVFTVCAGVNVIMVDISPVDDVDYTRLLMTARMFVVLDHHEGAKKYDGKESFFRVEQLSGASAAYYYTKKSASKLLYDVVRCVHARDLFTFGGDDEQFVRDWSLVFGHTLRQYATTPEQLAFIHRVCNDQDEFDAITADKDGVAASLNSEIKALSSLAVRKIINGVKVIVIDFRKIQSEIHVGMNDTGNILSKQHGCPVLFIMNNKEGTPRVSLRGPGSLAFAQTFGGGGHPCAAAFDASAEDTRARLDIE